LKKLKIDDKIDLGIIKELLFFTKGDKFEKISIKNLSKNNFIYLFNKIKIRKKNIGRINTMIVSKDSKKGSFFEENLGRSSTVKMKKDTPSSKQLTDNNPILELHHKDGNHNNNTLENCLLLCPNCHALTDSYCGKNSRKNN
jgi:hypothetical protein